MMSFKLAIHMINWSIFEKKKALVDHTGVYADTNKCQEKLTLSTKQTYAIA